MLVSNLTKKSCLKYSHFWLINSLMSLEIRILIIIVDSNNNHDCNEMLFTDWCYNILFQYYIDINIFPAYNNFRSKYLFHRRCEVEYAKYHNQEKLKYTPEIVFWNNLTFNSTIIWIKKIVTQHDLFLICSPILVN